MKTLTMTTTIYDYFPGLPGLANFPLFFFSICLCLIYPQSPFFSHHFAPLLSKSSSAFPVALSLLLPLLSLYDLVITTLMLNIAKPLNIFLLKISFIASTLILSLYQFNTCPPFLYTSTGSFSFLFLSNFSTCSFIIYGISLPCIIQLLRHLR